METTIFQDIMQNLIVPVMTGVTVIFAFRAQDRSRKPHPMLYATIRELVTVGTFKAENLINIGILKPEVETIVSPIEVLKFLKG